MSPLKRWCLTVENTKKNIFAMEISMNLIFENRKEESNGPVIGLMPFSLIMQFKTT